MQTNHGALNETSVCLHQSYYFKVYLPLPTISKIFISNVLTNLQVQHLKQIGYNMPINLCLTSPTIKNGTNNYHCQLTWGKYPLLNQSNSVLSVKSFRFVTEVFYFLSADHT